MRRDTARRIALYHAQLPHLKEKLGVVGMGLVIAALVSVSATFAWITLSRAPEVTAIDTTLSANGALEIALNRGKTPEDADIDESAAFDEALTAANIRWGNLINLNDPSYGIADLTLRPAQLNTAALTTSPFWSAVYGQDGRITELDSRYIYTKYSVDDKIFVATKGNEDYGVRAISSYKAQTTGETASEYEMKYKAVMAAHTEVNQYYMNSVTSAENVGSLGDALGTYLQSKVNEKGYGYHNDPKKDSSNLEMTPNQVQTLLNMFSGLQTAMEKEKTALAALANLQQYIYAQQKQYNEPYQELTWADIAAGVETYDIAGNKHKTGEDVTRPGEAVALTNLKKFISDAGDVDNDVAHLQTLVERTKQGEKVYSKEIEKQVFHICNGRDVILDGQTVDQALKDPVKTVLKMTGGTLPVVIGSGILRDFEQMAVDPAYRLPYGKDWSARRNRAPVHVEVYTSPGKAWVIDMTACLSTDASGGSHFMADYGKISPELAGGDRVAQDTYGMAVDFWLRSNAEKTYLTLEGAVVKDEGTNTVLSFDGVNRVWNTTNDAILTTASTTQGGGSCYTYYADSPEELQRSLRLLGSMKVAFMNTQSGVLLATAVMDTENYYALNGRVTVPLVLSTVDSMTVPGDAPETPDTPENPATPGEGETGGETSSETGGDTGGDTGSETQLRRAITVLYADREENLTAILYLDGANLTNQDVLSSGDIKGQLNLQFGSSEPLSTLGDSDLEMATRYVTAKVDTSEFEYSPAPDANMTTQVEIHVTGDQPEKMTGFFVREINAQQGTRQRPEMTFAQEKEGDKTTRWTASHTFTTPGTYYLHYVRMDGVDYRVAEPAKVVVRGFTVDSVTWSGMNNEKTYYTVDGSYQESVTAQVSFTDDALRPQRLQAVFTHTDGNSVYAELHSDGNGQTWTGSGSFTTSGTYTLRYLMVDGKAYDIGESAKTLHLYLGLSAKVSQGLDSPLTENYDKDHQPKVYKRNLQVWIRDNAGNPLEGLKGAKITYRPGTSASGAITVGLTPGSAGYYTAELGIVNPGRYVFDNIDTGGSGTIRTLTEEAPVFTIIPPDAPQYDQNSANSLNVEGVQYALLEQTAYIAPIRIRNSGAVRLEAVVYNSVTREYYTLSKGENLTYAVDNDGTWTLKLPAYTAENGQQRVDGVWQLVCLKLSSCYDGTDKMVLRDVTNPIVWLGITPEAESYKAKNGLTADKTFDFSRLSTEVISTVQVEMTPGKTALGGKNAAFMTQHKVADLGIAVTLRDYKGDVIPADKLTGATLHISYAANGDANTYGYAVRSAANRTYNIPLQRGEDGRWTVDTAQTGGDGYIWQYVGAYQVTSLELTAPKVGGATTKNFVPKALDTTGIPTQYTVTSAPPSLDAVKIIEAKNTAQFGKTPGGTVNGIFLAAYDPGASVKLELETKDAAGCQYALVPELAVKLELNYQNGTSAPNGGYTWKGTTGFEHYTVTLQQSGENTYISPAEQPLTLLAGSYQVKGTITARGSRPKVIEGLKTVQVYSVSPGLRVRQTEPGGNDIKVNPAGGIWAPAEKDLITTRNYYTTGGDYAVVYMQYIGPKDTEGVYYVSGKTEKDKTTSKNYARYKVPQVKLILSEQGVNYPATLTLPGDNGTEVSLKYTREEETLSADIGRLEIGEDATYKFKASDGKEYPVHHDTQKPVYFGTHTVTTVTTTVNGTSFTRALTKPVTISQQDKPVTAQTLTYTEPTGVTVAVRNTEDKVDVSSGGTVKPLMPVKVTLTAKEGYCKPRLSQPKGVYHWTVVSETADRAEYTFNMAFTATNLTPTVSEYPHITFPAVSANASIQVTAEGKSQASGVKLKAGTPVTVTVTAKQEAGYCLPVLRPSVPVTWETTSSTDFETVYTFKMPTENVTLAANTTQMHPIHFDAAAKLKFYVTQTNGAGSQVTVPKDGYAIPGRLITVNAVAVGGTDPVLKVTPDTLSVTAGPTTEGAPSRTYTFTMPQAAVTLGGTCTPAPVRTLRYSTAGNDFARIARVTVNGSPAEPVTADGVSSVSVMVGATVEITLAANDGYYEPRMPSQPVNGLTFTGPVLVAVDKDPAAHYGEATYSFTMPKGSDTDVLDLTRTGFTATEAPKISVKKDANSAGWYVTYTYIFSIDADGNEKQKSKSYMVNAAAQVFNDVTSAAPGTKLRVVVYSPVYRGYADTVYLTAVGATLGERQQKDYEISYYLTMGIEPVTIEIHPGK